MSTPLRPTKAREESKPLASVDEVTPKRPTVEVLPGLEGKGFLNPQMNPLIIQVLGDKSLPSNADKAARLDVSPSTITRWRQRVEKGLQPVVGHENREARRHPVLRLRRRDVVQRHAPPQGEVLPPGGAAAGGPVP